MKKIIVLLLITACTYIKAHAQSDNQFGFSIGPELGIPSQSAFGIGYGASAKFEVPVSSRLVITATGGYSSFNYKSGIVHLIGKQPSATFVPLKAGLRFTAGMGAYLEAEGGDAMETNGEKRNLFAFSIGPGFLIKINGIQNIDLGFRYESWSKHALQQTAIRVAYRLGW